MEKNNCNVIKDLLPNYIDSLTSDDTNMLIENHLKECKDCKKYFDEMNSEIEKEKLKDEKIVKEIKKYKRKIGILKIFISLIFIIILVSVLGNIGFKYYIVKNMLDANIDNNIYSNFRLEEYDESIERYENYYITYLSNKVMKKVYDDKCIEYWEGNEHYYIDNDNKTYYIVNEEIYNEETNELNYNLNIDIGVIDELQNIMESNDVNFISILKFILNTDNLVIGKEGFRDTEYYIVKDALENNRIYIDRNNFVAQKVQLNKVNTKEYRFLPDSARWYDVIKPDLTGYTNVGE